MPPGANGFWQMLGHIVECLKASRPAFLSQELYLLALLKLQRRIKKSYRRKYLVTHRLPAAPPLLRKAWGGLTYAVVRTACYCRDR